MSKFKAGDIVKVVGDCGSLHGLPKGAQDTVVSTEFCEKYGWTYLLLESNWYVFEGEVDFVTNLEYESIEAGYYSWKRFEDSEAEVIKVVADAAGLHIKTFDGCYTETLYGNFLHKIEV